MVCAFTTNEFGRKQKLPEKYQVERLLSKIQFVKNLDINIKEDAGFSRY